MTVNDHFFIFKGRKKKVGEALLPAIFGFKAMGVVAFTLTMIGALVLKALAVAKLAVLVSSALLISKYLHHKEPTYVEYDHQGSEAHPMYAEYPTATGESLHFLSIINSRRSRF